MSESRYKVFLTNARQHLDEKNFTKFMENISVAKFLAEEQSEALEEVLYTYIKGLYDFEDYKAALEQLEIAIPLFDGEKKYRLLKTKGIVLGKLGALNDAIDLFTEISQLKQYPALQVSAINNLSWAYIYLARKTSTHVWLEKAIEKCNDAIKVFDIIENDGLKKIILNNLGTAFWYQGNPQGAIKAFKRALKYHPEDPKLFNNLASTYGQLGDYQSFKEWIEKAEEVAEQTGNMFEMAQNYYIRAEEFEKKADYYRSIEYYSLAYQQFSLVQAMLEMHECRDKISELRVIIDRENRKIEHASLSTGLGVPFGEDFAL